MNFASTALTQNALKLTQFLYKKFLEFYLSKFLFFADEIKKNESAALTHFFYASVLGDLKLTTLYIPAHDTLKKKIFGLAKNIFFPSRNTFQ